MTFVKTLSVPDERKLDVEARYIAYWQLWHHNWDDRDIDLIAATPDLASKKVLEIGCGDGRVAFALAPLCRELTAVDLNGQFIEIANQNSSQNALTNLTFAPMDACALSYSDESFDLVLLPWVVQMVSDPGKAIAEAHRVLKTGGEMIVIGLRTDADYDKIISQFCQNNFVIDPSSLYETPINSHFRTNTRAQLQTFDYFFESLPIAIEAFTFALDRWYKTPLNSSEKYRLHRVLQNYKLDERIRIKFPANVYRVTKR